MEENRIFAPFDENLSLSSAPATILHPRAMFNRSSSACKRARLWLKTDRSNENRQIDRPELLYHASGS